jgi:flagellar motor switch protein FliN
MTTDTPLHLENLEHNMPANGDDGTSHSAAELAPVFDVPVKIQAVLGKTSVDVATLLRLSRGSVLELDRKVGEAIDIYVNNRLVARGEVVLVEERLGVTMTEIIKDGEAT